jgi:nuclear transport factor 2 (NTF2) superfamily protein
MIVLTGAAMTDDRPPLPPFDDDTARAEVLAAEAAWNTRDRSYGNENREFDEHGLMRRREASINDVAIDETDRRLFGPRADGDASGIPLR